MYHLDIPKTRQYDNGKIEVIARSSVGEARTETTLTVKPRSDDYRGVLKSSPRRKYFDLHDTVTTQNVVQFSYHIQIFFANIGRYFSHTNTLNSLTIQHIPLLRQNEFFKNPRIPLYHPLKIPFLMKKSANPAKNHLAAPKATTLSRIKMLMKFDQ